MWIYKRVSLDEGYQLPLDDGMWTTPATSLAPAVGRPIYSNNTKNVSNCFFTAYLLYKDKQRDHCTLSMEDCNELKVNNIFRLHESRCSTREVYATFANTYGFNAFWKDFLHFVLCNTCSILTNVRMSFSDTGAIILSQSLGFYGSPITCESAWENCIKHRRLKVNNTV